MMTLTVRGQYGGNTRIFHVNTLTEAEERIKEYVRLYSSKHVRINLSGEGRNTR